MVFFEDFLDKYSALCASLLFIPFLALRRQQRPLKHVVGGLDPFQEVSAHGQSKQRKRPLSFWLFLFAYLLAAGCLFSAHRGAAPTLTLVDQSHSALRAGIKPPSDNSNVTVIGSSSNSVQAHDLLQRLSGLSSDRDVAVWTDLEKPTFLPESVQWINPNPEEAAEVLGVLLSAQPMDATHWRVHWALQGGATARLVSGEWRSESLQGGMGTSMVPVPGPTATIQLLVDGKEKTASTVGAFLELPSVAIQIPEHANSAWEALALASWPSAIVGNGSTAALEVNGQAIPLGSLWSVLSWEREPQPEELAFFAKTVRSAIQALHPPRDVREFLPQPQVSAAGFKIPVRAGLHSGQIPKWMVFVVLLACISAALAWLRIPREGKVAYSEV